MGKDGYVLLDTSAFENAMKKRSEILKEYNAILSKYDIIINTLLKDWKGSGADAFRKDAKTVNTNIASLSDILTTLCDTIADCRDVFQECDKAMGEHNRQPLKE